VYKAINSTETSIDTIIEASGLMAGAVSAALLQLEMRRLVRQLPGKFFVKLL
jgi:DNA processing protein